MIREVKDKSVTVVLTFGLLEHTVYGTRASSAAHLNVEFVVVRGLGFCHDDPVQV